jgi:hypothetical protein
MRRVWVLILELTIRANPDLSLVGPLNVMICQCVATARDFLRGSLVAPSVMHRSQIVVFATPKLCVSLFELAPFLVFASFGFCILGRKSLALLRS